MLRRFCVLACAWVLWEQALGMISGGGRGSLFTWEQLEAFNTKAECDKAKTAATAAAPQPKPGEKRSQLKRVCLPDTINPK